MPETVTAEAARAAYWVPNNPRPLCRDFTPKPAPAAFWCTTCGWNEPMHADENARSAIAAELKRLDDEAICGDENDGDFCDLDPGHDGMHTAGATVGWLSAP